MSIINGKIVRKYLLKIRYKKHLKGKNIKYKAYFVYFIHLF